MINKNRRSSSGDFLYSNLIKAVIIRFRADYSRFFAIKKADLHKIRHFYSWQLFGYHMMGCGDLLAVLSSNQKEHGSLPCSLRFFNYSAIAPIGGLGVLD